ncbi:hypothetical protein [Paraburkholderia kirstenboschensis]|uniref:Uncharacterized protein n=1 Tax=Paraburkholderia kirstenboschensis TaxID=1245436 RepID=A0ABZ0EPZ5_9BURK|nr:hypothetical protein [Paraburkholderia kirstenboschensis]WOD18666.1 hypothetical protein RW095_38870 [Paraburkholderia kirstenboschensis]
MCFGNPDAILAGILGAKPLESNDLGHTVLDDFEHFCAYTGCSVERIGPEAFAWAKLAFVSACT